MRCSTINPFTPWKAEAQRNAGHVAAGQLVDRAGHESKLRSEALEDGGWDIAIAENGTGLFTQHFAGSGAIPSREIDTTTNAIIESVKGHIFKTRTSHAGVDRSLLFLQQSNLSSGPTSTYTAGGGYSNNRDLLDFQGDKNSAVSPNGQLIAVEVNSTVVIFDADYTAIEQLNGYRGGMLFHPVQPLLLVIDAVTDQLVAFDTTDWEERYCLSIGENVDNSTPLGQGVMTTNADGSLLFLITGSGVRIIALPAASGVATRMELQKYTSYVNIGANTQLTVTIRDPAGNFQLHRDGPFQQHGSRRRIAGAVHLSRPPTPVRTRSRSASARAVRKP